MSFTRRVVLAAAVVCCSLTMMEASGGDDKPPALDDAPIRAVVAHFATNGVKLEADERGWWVVGDPKGDGYQVVVHLRTFPTAATGKEMRDELETINLGYMLNVPSRVAMSHPSLRVPDATKKTPRVAELPVAAKLEKLFKEYQPPPRDPVYSSMPDAVRKVVEDAFPHHRCIRLVIRGRDEAAVYRVRCSTLPTCGGHLGVWSTGRASSPRSSTNWRWTPTGRCLRSRSACSTRSGCRRRWRPLTRSGTRRESKALRSFGRPRFRGGRIASTG